MFDKTIEEFENCSIAVVEVFMDETVGVYKKNVTLVPFVLKFALACTTPSNNKEDVFDAVKDGVL